MKSNETNQISIIEKDNDCDTISDVLIKEHSIDEILSSPSKCIEYDSPIENELIMKLILEFQDTEYSQHLELLEYLSKIFLRFRSHQYLLAKERLQNYLKWRLLTFSSLNFQYLKNFMKIQELIKSNCFFILPNKLPTGEAIFYIKMKNCLPNLFCAEDIVKCWHFLALNEIKKDSSLIKKGFIIINNMNETLLSNLDLKFPFLMASAINDSLPIRLKKMILFKPPFYIRFIIPIIKSILSTKLSSRFEVLYNFHEIFSLINCNENYLPDDIGGIIKLDGTMFLEQLLIDNMKI